MHYAILAGSRSWAACEMACSCSSNKQPTPERHWAWFRLSSAANVVGIVRAHLAQYNVTYHTHGWLYSWETMLTQRQLIVCKFQRLRFGIFSSFRYWRWAHLSTRDLGEEIAWRIGPERKTGWRVSANCAHNKQLTASSSASWAAVRPPPHHGQTQDQAHPSTFQFR